MTMPLSPAELARIRAAHTANLTGTCTVRRKIQAINAYGGASDTWQTVGTFPCRVMPERDRRLSATLAERETMTVYYRLTVQHDADIRPDDEVLYDSVTYEIVALWDDHDLRTARRAVLAKVA